MSFTKREQLLILLLSLLCVFVFAPHGIDTIKEKFGNGYSIEIRGDSECHTRTKATLSFMENESKPDFLYVKHRIGIIECLENKSGVFVWENPPRFTVGKEIWRASVTWYAGSIAHDACHVEQYRNNKPYIGEDAEKECITIQDGVLTRLNAPQREHEMLVNAFKTRYWEIPYENRDW